jgi:hypothetical protein
MFLTYVFSDHYVFLFIPMHAARDVYGFFRLCLYSTISALQVTDNVIAGLIIAT